MIGSLLKHLTPKNPLQPLFDLRPTLTTLAAEVQAIRYRLMNGDSDGITMIVPFFNVVSKVQDDGQIGAAITAIATANKHGKFHQELAELRELAIHIERAGRQSCGFNRTVPGQQVTANDIYLGGIHGYHTKTAAFIKGQKTIDPEFYDVCRRQAEGFMRSHLDIIVLCRSLSART